jgi:hypothetical protein
MSPGSASSRSSPQARRSTLDVLRRLGGRLGWGGSLGRQKRWWREQGGGRYKERGRRWEAGGAGGKKCDRWAPQVVVGMEYEV